MTTAAEFRRAFVVPGLDLLATLGGPARTPVAETMLIAIAGQESGWIHRQQIRGPARGFWQFERNGGVAGVLQHSSSHQLARALCDALDVVAFPGAVHSLLAVDDCLACGFARLLLWTDPRPLPTSQDDGWEYYLRNWRPGKPHPKRWPSYYAAAAAAVSIAWSDEKQREDTHVQPV